MRMVNYKLVKNEEKYFEYIRELRNSPELLDGFIDRTYITQEMQKEYMAKHKDEYYICVEKESNKPVGIIGIVDKDLRLAVQKDEQRKGIASFMIDEISKISDFEVQVKTDNVASLRTFKKKGFKIIGKSKKSGVDVYLLSKNPKNIVKIVELMDGLGNQMFQYAFGKALAYKTGHKVLFDNFSYSNEKNKGDLEKNGVAVRNFELNVFNLNIDFADEKDVKMVKSKPNLHILRHFFSKKYKNHNKILEWPYNVYDETLFTEKNFKYYSGYFQIEKYFKCIENTIREAFEFPKFENELDIELENKINNANNSVAIHIRRGDYITCNPEIICSLDYYKNAVNLMKEKLDNPTFFVFCDPKTLEWVKTEFNIDADYEILQSSCAISDMHLMSLCKNVILANSSYSWWAGWLNKNPDKIIIAPDPWNEDGQTENICESWIKVNRM